MHPRRKIDLPQQWFGTDDLGTLKIGKERQPFGGQRLILDGNADPEILWERNVWDQLRTLGDGEKRAIRPLPGGVDDAQRIFLRYLLMKRVGAPTDEDLLVRREVLHLIKGRLVQKHRTVETTDAAFMLDQFTVMVAVPHRPGGTADAAAWAARRAAEERIPKPHFAPTGTPRQLITAFLEQLLHDGSILDDEADGYERLHVVVGRIAAGICGSPTADCWGRTRRNAGVDGRSS